MFGIIVFVILLFNITTKNITMPISNDNQDYGQSDEKNKSSSEPTDKGLTSDDLKGKKVDADLDKEIDKPAEQKK